MCHNHKLEGTVIILIEYLYKNERREMYYIYTGNEKIKYSYLYNTIHSHK